MAWFVLKVFVLLALASGAVSAGPPPTVTAAHVEHGENETRLALAVSHPIPFHVFTLTGPHRVVIDLAEVGWALPQETIILRQGPIERLRFAHHKPGVSRIVADLSEVAVVRQATLVPASVGSPHRLVVTMATPSLKGRAAPTATTATFSQGALSTGADRGLPRPRHRPQPRVIVLDPGHGGKDPGGIGVSGVYEKTITLLAARQVREALSSLGPYKVILTRNGDSFVPLRGRIAIAQRAKADLFVSLHADARSNPETRGASVYTLSERASDAEAAALARRENEADLLNGIRLVHAGRDVSGILIDLVQRNTMNRSAALASTLVDGFAGHALLLPNSHRFAGFAVLRAPDVPSVLIELGFLSNAEDEALLRDGEHRHRLAMVIARAIDIYFTHGVATIDE